MSAQSPGARALAPEPGAPRRLRSAGSRGALALALVLSGCDASSPAPAGPAQAPGEPIDPTSVAQAETSAVDPAWLCSPGEGDAPQSGEDPGVFTPQTLSVEGNELTVSGPFSLDAQYELTGITPEATIVPSDPENRSVPAQDYDVALGEEGAPTPPLVVRARVQSAHDGAAPSALTTRFVVGTCDDAPLRDGPYLVRIQGGDVEGPRIDGEDPGWSAASDVMVDVIGGELRAVPGAITSADGQIPADTSALACGTMLESRGDGDGLSIEAQDPVTTVPTHAEEEADTVGASAQILVTSPDLGTRALLPGIVLTSPEGRILAGARNAETIGLDWFTAEGVSRTETVWTSQLTCHRGALDAGEYQAHGFALTVDAEGETHLLLTDPWTVEIVEPEPES